MRWVQVTVPQADGYSLHVIIQKFLDAFFDLFLIERDSLLAKHIYAAIDPFDQSAGHQRSSVPVSYMMEKVLISVASPGLATSFMKENVFVSTLCDNPHFLTGLGEKYI
jgi:hypothetical protein